MKNEPNDALPIEELEQLCAGIRASNPDDANMWGMHTRPTVDVEVNSL